MGRFPPELKRAAGQQQSCFIKHPSQDALEVHAGAGSQMMPMTLLDMMYDFSVSPRGDNLGQTEISKLGVVTPDSEILSTVAIRRLTCRKVTRHCGSAS